MKTKVLISFSGGETSAYMAQWLWNHKHKEYEMIFVFANTGEENEETLKFVQQCSLHFGFPVVWLETVPRVKVANKIVEMCTPVFLQNWIGGRVGTSFKIVDYFTASREGQPFEKIIQKYGIPNMSTPHCTRELKQHPIMAYAKSLGWKEYYTALGIRNDEIDRMNKNYVKKRLLYPLIQADMQPMTKPKINFWWSQQPFRLELKGYQGNCKTCWKKSDHKLFTIANENEKAFSFMGKMEARYDQYIPESRLQLMTKRGDEIKLPCTFFRGNRSTIDIINQAKYYDGTIKDDAQEFDLVGGETCEPFSDCP